jgi:hypothetical protein
MEKRKCPALVDGKKCGLALILVEREPDTAIDVYECPLGHRTHKLLGEIEKQKCPALVDDKKCGRALVLVERDLETATGIYECTLGHRTYVPLEPRAVDSS